MVLVCDETRRFSVVATEKGFCSCDEKGRLYGVATRRVDVVQFRRRGEVSLFFLFQGFRRGERNYSVAMKSRDCPVATKGPVGDSEDDVLL